MSHPSEVHGTKIAVVSTDFVRKKLHIKGALPPKVTPEFYLLYVIDVFHRPLVCITAVAA